MIFPAIPWVRVALALATVLAIVLGLWWIDRLSAENARLELEVAGLKAQAEAREEAFRRVDNALSQVQRAAEGRAKTVTTIREVIRDAAPPACPAPDALRRGLGVLNGTAPAGQPTNPPGPPVVP